MIVKMKGFQAVLAAIQAKKAKIGVIGLGYVGLPLVHLFAKAGFPVTGFDIDDEKVDQLNQGKSYIKHISDQLLADLVKKNSFQATTDFSLLRDMNAVIVCVPTPLTENREPDMSFIVSTAQVIRDHLPKGQLIILESTTYPGTLRSVVRPVLEESGLSAGTDFFMAYSPEREDPGNRTHSVASIPKVVGGLDDKSHRLACALYGSVLPQVVPVSSPEVAEAAKILENTYRAVNIALVNELKLLFERMDIDIWEVIDAAKTKPFGFQAFYPGPGLGGHCIPIDPFYLSWVARQYNWTTRFIELAGEINARMPDYVIQRVALALNSKGKSIKDAKICVLGVAYKKNVDDMRESPSLTILDHLKALGADISYHDPFVPTLTHTRKYTFNLESVSLTKKFLESLDAVIIATDHDCVDYKLVSKHAPLLVDTRNATKKVVAAPEKVWAA